jgi:hypothetical protein
MRLFWHVVVICNVPELCWQYLVMVTVSVQLVAREGGERVGIRTGAGLRYKAHALFLSQSHLRSIQPTNYSGPWLVTILTFNFN